ncbi:dihydroneopterin aldolase [Candidatus Nitrospira bockiana]
MVDIVLQGIEFTGSIGVTAEERLTPQPLAVDLKLVYPAGHERAPGSTDDLRDAIDYAQIVQRVTEIGSRCECRLLERLAEILLEHLFSEFPIARISLWVRKLRPPLPDVRGSVGIKLTRTREELLPPPKPAPFLVEQLPLLISSKVLGGTALDVAAGRGRHSLYLARLGMRVDAIDRDVEALEHLTSIAERQKLPGLSMKVVDLEDPAHPPDWPKEHYELIIVFFYLYRPVFPQLLAALKPGGVLLYETFLIDNHLHHHHPRRREFCLAHNELLTLVPGLRILFYQEGEHPGAHGEGSAFTARLAARKED